MLFGTWSQAHAYDPSDYMEIRHKGKRSTREALKEKENLVKHTDIKDKSTNILLIYF